MRPSALLVSERNVVCFSPVAGIQWVETEKKLSHRGSIPISFSPVAGIQWVETGHLRSNRSRWQGFSPVAGIQWVETLSVQHQPGRATVSVPLPGFSGLRLGLHP